MTTPTTHWYATFRSLIASCSLHGLNPQEYLEQVLTAYLADHGPSGVWNPYVPGA